MKKVFIFSIVIISLLSGLKAQTVYQDISKHSIYDFLDELANDQIIDINSVVKPYSRKFIYQSLMKAKKQKSLLSKRQQEEVDFYLLDYGLDFEENLPARKPNIDFLKKKELLAAINPVGIHYKDEKFTFSIRPIWGIRYYSKKNKTIFHRWGGLEAHATIGHWGFFSSLRDNNQTNLLALPDYFNQQKGGVYKRGVNSGGTYSGDYSEARGGVTYSNDWGTVGIVKDYLTWGNNYHGSNILNDKAPSFPQIKVYLHPVDWFEFNYFHAFLVSQVVDSSRSYYYPHSSGQRFRPVYRPKFMAANIFTVKPWKRLHFSFGNSIIYSDKGVQLAYLIPVMFFKSIDHTINANIDNENSQIFFDISSRQIKHLHLYASFFIDEFKISRIRTPDEHNFWSEKIGFRLSDLFVKNYSLTFEYTKTMPIVYNHRVPSLTFASNKFSLGHYLKDNSREFYIEANMKPLRGLYLKAYYVFAQHGNDYDYVLDSSLTRHAFLEKVMWQEKTVGFSAQYEVFNNVFVFTSYRISDIQGDTTSVQRHTPEFFIGKNNIISFGFNMGF